MEGKKEKKEKKKGIVLRNKKISSDFFASNLVQKY